MSSDIAAPAGARFSVAGVIADTFRVLGRNVIGFVLVAIVLRAIWVFGAAPAGGDGATTWTDWPSQVANPLLRLALAGLAQLLFAFVVLRTLRGEKARLDDYLRGLRAVIPAIVVTLICFLPPLCAFVLRMLLPVKHEIGAFVGMIMAVISLVAVVTWWLALPVIAVEGKGPFAGLARCVRLTKGRRLHLLGVTAIIAVLFAGAGYLATDVLGLSAVEAATPVPITPARAAWFLVTVLLAALLAAMATVTYERLRLEKEGSGSVAATTLAPG